MFFIVASGESLTQKDCDYIKGKGTIIVINNTFKMIPSADILYACDVVWWEAYEKQLRTWKGQKMSVFYDKNGCKKWDYTTKLNGLGKDKIHTGGNSGYQAINLAYLLGAKEIILLGFDMKGGHWHGKHKHGLNNQTTHFKPWIGHMNILASDLKKEGVKVINCTRDTALECFEQRELKEIC